MSKTLFLASTPLHLFFSLGLMQGAFRGQAHTLALIDQRPGDREPLADALQSAAPGPSVVRFPTLRSLGSVRAVLEQITDFTRALAPSTILVGNDRRTEFYAALRGHPSARRAYIDDGLYSYLPRHVPEPAWSRRLSSWRRSRKFALELERPASVGGSQAVQDAYVLLPQRVHAGLRDKRVQALEPAWFADAWVREVCRAAADAAGFDATRCTSIGLLLLLPHPRFLLADPSLKGRLEALAAAYAEQAQAVAIKAHPSAADTPLQEQLRLPAGVVEVPARLPVEVLVPLLSGTLVVGTLTTALLTLALLGDRVRVRSLPPGAATAASSYDRKAFEIYRSVGIEVLGEEAAA